jgi:hypothetical protein
MDRGKYLMSSLTKGTIRIKLRQDTASNWTSQNPTLASGELGFETDSGRLKIGDGSTAWTALNYLGTIEIRDADGDSITIDHNDYWQINEGTGINVNHTDTGTPSFATEISCDLEGTELKSTGEGGGTKFLREDGDGTCSWQTVAGGGGTTLKHWMDWYIYNANLASQNYFYSALHNDEYGVSSTINTDLSLGGYGTTVLLNAWRMIRTSRRVPYAGTITKYMVHLESTGAAADSDVEVALWWADALADDTAHASAANFTCDHLATLTFDFSSASRFMTKQTTSFNATSISEGDWLFITLRKTTSGDGSSFHCHPTILWDGA